MKKKHVLLMSLGVAAVVVALLGELLLVERRRPRPAGWRAEWDSLPLIKEGEWSIDIVKRGVVQGEFFSATDQLARCVRRYPGAEGQVLVLELLVETEQGGTHFEYVDAAPNPAVPQKLVSCIAKSLEDAVVLPTPGLPVGTRWRLQVNFLVPPLEELPKAPPWWKRLWPGNWRSGPSSDGHVG